MRVGLAAITFAGRRLIKGRSVASQSGADGPGSHQRLGATSSVDMRSLGLRIRKALAATARPSQNIAKQGGLQGGLRVQVA